MRVDLPTFCFHPDSSTLTREEIQLLPTADETVHRDPKSDHSSPPLVNEQDFSNDIESYDCVKNDFSTEEMFKPRPSGKLRLVEEKSGEDKVVACWHHHHIPSSKNDRMTPQSDIFVDHSTGHGRDTFSFAASQKRLARKQLRRVCNMDPPGGVVVDDEDQKPTQSCKSPSMNCSWWLGSRKTSKRQTITGDCSITPQNTASCGENPLSITKQVSKEHWTEPSSSGCGGTAQEGSMTVLKPSLDATVMFPAKGRPTKEEERQSKSSEIVDATTELQFNDHFHSSSSFFLDDDASQSQTSNNQVDDIVRQKTGRWAEDEKVRFYQGYQAYHSYGRGKWTKIAEFVKTRDPDQVRSHAQKVLLTCSSKASST
eukprot:CAMPEP_0194679878 /NCGR_PEP_ID=MMETSP0295-20121207/11083_1 /TAXON_ID=39354 /ORGANISM="Heterosigma akashiwo, Strain CCMP2393" /LENGTH=369 /DNA_ID=CAMNT_0039565423 /DNA_START=104 /DNA_END=1213 /DNA_ORIENTATION=+